MYQILLMFLFFASLGKGGWKGDLKHFHKTGKLNNEVAALPPQAATERLGSH